MNGRTLALGAVAGLAAVALAQRGSRNVSAGDRTRVLQQVTDTILDGMQRDGWWDGPHGARVLRHDRPTAWDINNGFCEDWAEEARRRVGGEVADLAALKTRKFGLPRGIFDDVSHVVLLLDGRFYDAQDIHGVDDPRQLHLVRGVSRQAFVRGSTNADDFTLETLRSARAAMDPLFADPAFWIDALDRQAARALRRSNDVRRGLTSAESEGFCYYAAHAVQSMLGGTLVRAAVRGPGREWVWHTWNVLTDGREADVTGDQFGFKPVQLADHVYRGLRRVKLRKHPFQSVHESAHVTNARVAAFDQRVREGVLVAAVRASLSPDLLAPGYTGAPGSSAGHCAVASEALYHLLGGKASGWTPANVQHEGVSHWFLRHASGRVLDATADQFSTPVDYVNGRGRGFQTPRRGATVQPPSRRAQVVIDRVESRIRTR